ncbi:hypothetical protein GGS23DRAFT_597890 [Durotheca rogersii]|uniref:uncharacterized protein n=1 Tax=Durotheca rogersii TaxID=419775 RepID=UPI00222055B3|nr:uncharacterized protein GGS23DRAFT_597890 [Durotheca rogersii]KAI5862282.1 hypothetical protein GGS23DRAFT_597890 [Durotheca rogersii]
MACDTDPLGLYDPGSDPSNPTFPESDPDAVPQSFTFPNHPQQLSWDPYAPEKMPAGEGYLDQSRSILDVDLDGYSLAAMSGNLISPPSWKPPSGSPARRSTCDAHGCREISETHDARHRDKRRRRDSKSSTSSLSLHDDDGGGGDAASQRHHHRLEKNRVAASKCRQKKKRETAILQERERGLAAQRQSLKLAADSLRDEVVGLRNEVLKHGMCDCSVIQRYIMETARQVA